MSKSYLCLAGLELGRTEGRKEVVFIGMSQNISSGEGSYLFGRFLHTHKDAGKTQSPFSPEDH